MKKLKGRAKYIGLTMPAPLMEEVGDFVNDNDSYRSKNEFVKYAIREKLDKLDEMQYWKSIRNIDKYENILQKIVNFRIKITDFLNSDEALLLIAKHKYRELEDKLIHIKKDIGIPVIYGDIILIRYLLIRLIGITMALGIEEQNEK
jgi:hypothetical protein